MLTSEIAACCKKLRLSRNIVEMSGKIQADNHQEYLLKLLSLRLYTVRKQGMLSY